MGNARKVAALTTVLCASRFLCCRSGHTLLATYFVNSLEAGTLSWGGGGRLGFLGWCGFELLLNSLRAVSAWAWCLLLLRCWKSYSYWIEKRS